MTSDMPRVAAIILNWCRPDETIACFRTVAALDYAALDIVILDNYSNDGSQELIERAVRDALGDVNEARLARGFAPFAVETYAADELKRMRAAGPEHCHVSLVQTGRNGGYAFGNNVGIRLALRDSETRYVWILNNDTLVSEHALTMLVQTMEADRAIGLCGSLVMFLDRPDRVQTLGGGRFRPYRARCEQLGTGLTRDDLPDRAQVERQLSYVNGAAVLVSRRMIDAVGLMDEGYFLYFEEIDWAERAQKAGFRLGYRPEAVVYHRVGAAAGTSLSGSAALLSTYYMERSKFRFLRRRHPWLVPLARLFMLKTLLAYLWRREFALANAHMRGAIGCEFEH